MPLLNVFNASMSHFTHIKKLYKTDQSISGIIIKQSTKLLHIRPNDFNLYHNFCTLYQWTHGFKIKIVELFMHHHCSKNIVILLGEILEQ